LLEEKAPLHTYMTFPHSSDTEAYNDALPPHPKHHHHLTTYSNACWGSQIGNAIREGIQLPLFKFCSMSGAIIYRSGSPITWKTDQQERTSLSSCDTEICATNMGARLTVNLRNLILHLQSLGYPINDTDLATPLYNDNEVCVKWCHNLTMKGNRHIEHKKPQPANGLQMVLSPSHTSLANAIPRTYSLKRCATAQTSADLRVFHVARFGFPQEYFHFSPSPSKPLHEHVAQTANYVLPSLSGILDVLISQPSSRMHDAISCLSSAGRYSHVPLRPMFPAYENYFSLFLFFLCFVVCMLCTSKR
jgi:hypothetical protein